MSALGRNRPLPGPGDAQIFHPGLGRVVLHPPNHGSQVSKYSSFHCFKFLSNEAHAVDGRQMRRDDRFFFFPRHLTPPSALCACVLKPLPKRRKKMKNVAGLFPNSFPETTPTPSITVRQTLRRALPLALVLASRWLSTAT